MPLPESIAEAVKVADTNFDPEKTHSDFASYEPTWRLYLDLLELDQAKLQTLIEKFEEGEEQAKVDRRIKLAAVFNYVPTIIRMVVNYIFSQQPMITSKDAQLMEFIADADGNGTPLADYIKLTALPLSMSLGFVDVLIESPATDEGNFISGADDAAANMIPRAFTITPLVRTNWSVDASHRYQWIRFKDLDADNPDPFSGDAKATHSYITFTRARSEIVDPKQSNQPAAFWMRSWKAPMKDEAGKATSELQWMHDGGFIKFNRVPIETLYFARSNDPAKRHFGLSKIAMIAVLTKKIVQLLSWTDEDIIANLAVFVFPGDPPKDEVTGKEIPVTINPFSIVWLRGDPKVQATVLQGSDDHIAIKMKLIDTYVREVMRIAYMIGASAEAEQIQSGVQGVVARNELFMELSDFAGKLDTFIYGLLALAKSWIAGEEWTPERLRKETGTAVDFFKGPYMIDPLEVTIKNGEALISLFGEISPAMVKETYRSIASAALYNESATRQTVFNEIDQNFKAVAEEKRKMREALVAGVDDAAADENIPPNPLGESE